MKLALGPLPAEPSRAAEQGRLTPSFLVSVPWGPYPAAPPLGPPPTTPGETATACPGCSPRATGGRTRPLPRAACTGRRGPPKFLGWVVNTVGCAACTPEAKDEGACPRKRRPAGIWDDSKCASLQTTHKNIQKPAAETALALPGFSLPSLRGLFCFPDDHKLLS